jgi:hypothetical protein
MFSIICGTALVAVTGAGFWYLLPRNDQEHPLVKNSGVGSMITIAIMVMLTAGVAMVFEGLFG